MPINTSHPQPKQKEKLLNYLSTKIGISEKALKLGIKQAESEQAPLPIVLWSFGLLDLHQLQNVLDWQNNQE